MQTVKSRRHKVSVLWTAVVLTFALPIAASAVALESFVLQCDPRCDAVVAAINQIPGARVEQVYKNVPGLAVTLPVSDVDRAKTFYEGLGWRLDADIVVGDAFRVVQLTPPQSACSIAFGTGLTTGEPGSVKRLLLVVEDIFAAREEIEARGVAVSEVFHLAGGRAQIDARERFRRRAILGGELDIDVVLLAVHLVARDLAAAQ